MNATTRDTTLLTRPAMRFILRHRRGILAALDPESGQTISNNVVYAVDNAGRLIGYITSADALVDAIAAEAAVSLTVEAAQSISGAITDETGMPTEYAIDRVRALVDATIIDRSPVGPSTATVTLDIYDIEVDCREVAA